MYLCETCGSNLKINVSNLIDVFAVPRITQSGLEITEVSLERTPLSTTRVATQFTCPICGLVEHDNVLVECSHCYRHFKPKDLSIFKEVGGQYCEEGKDEYSESGITPISAKDLLHTIKLTEKNR